MKTRKTRVFISYSRKDISFARKLNDALDAAGVNAWVDWEGIPPSADWMKEIETAIRDSDAFVFVISPDSLASEVCAAELELGIGYSKKLVPVLHVEPDKQATMHPRLKSINWVYARAEQDDFDGAIKKILEGIQTDLEWVQMHTRLLQRANEWVGKKRNRSYLLRGSELEEAQRWMTESASESGRAVLPLQAEYVTASRKSAFNFLRLLAGAIGLALLFSLVLGRFAVQQRNEAMKLAENLATQKAIANENAARADANAARADANAEEADRKAQEALLNMQRAEQSEKVSQAQRSAALAKIYQSRADGLDTSSLLAIDAYQQLPGLSDAEYILRHNISLLATPLKQTSVGSQIELILGSPDRVRFLSADAEGNICLWKFEDGSKYFCVKQPGQLNDVAFSADGGMFVTASATEVIFWNAEDGSKVKTFRYEDNIWDISAHPNGRWFGVGRANGYSLIDAGNMQEIYFYTGLDVRKIAFDPLGSYMALATQPGYVSLWQVFTDNTLLGLLHKNAEPLDVAYSPGGKWLVSGGTDSMARILRVGSSRPYFISHGDWVREVAFGPTDSWFVTVSDDGFVRVIDTVDYNGNVNIRERLRIAHDGYVATARISRAGQWIASTGSDHTVRVWDAFSGAEVMRLPLNGSGFAVEFSADASRLVAGDHDGNITLWDISRLQACSGLVQFSGSLREVHFSPDGNWVVANSEDKKVWLIRAELLGAEDDQRRELPGVTGLTSKIAVSKDSSWIAAVQYDNEETLYNVVVAPADGSVSPITLDTGQVSAITFAPDSKQLVVANEYGTVSIWDITTRERVDNFNAGGSVTSMTISPDGRYLVTGIEQGNYSIAWNLSARAHSWKTLRQFGAITSVQFSNDGTLLATGSSNALVYLWRVNADAFELLASFRVDGSVDSIQFNPSDTILAVGDSAGLAFLFDLEKDEEVARLRHANDAPSVSFSADGSRLAVVSLNGINLWDMNAIPFTYKDQLIETACSRLTRNLKRNEWTGIFSNRTYSLICPANLTIGAD